MKYILGLYHSLLLSYIGWFGGKIEDRTLFIYWTIQVNPKAVVKLERLNIFTLRNLNSVFYIRLVN